MDCKNDVLKYSELSDEDDRFVSENGIYERLVFGNGLGCKHFSVDHKSEWK